MPYKNIIGVFGNGTEYLSSDLTPERLAYWAKVPKWTIDEAAALLCEMEPDFVEMFPDTMSDIQRLLKRAAPSDYQDGAPPASWLALAEKLNVHVPAELKSEVERVWPEEQLAGNNHDETACRKQLIAMMKSAPDNPRLKTEVRQEFSNVGIKAFNRAWANAHQLADAPKWSAPGRRKRPST
jgi:hypothetical protein